MAFRSPESRAYLTTEIVGVTDDYPSPNPWLNIIWLKKVSPEVTKCFLRRATYGKWKSWRATYAERSGRNFYKWYANGANLGISCLILHISLICIIAKIYNRLILNRIRSVIDPKLRYNQNGFRPKRTTVAQILALRRIKENTIKRSNIWLFLKSRPSCS